MDFVLWFCRGSAGRFARRARRIWTVRFLPIQENTNTSEYLKHFNPFYKYCGLVVCVFVHPVVIHHLAALDLNDLNETWATADEVTRILSCSRADWKIQIPVRNRYCDLGLAKGSNYKVEQIEWFSDLTAGCHVHFDTWGFEYRLSFSDESMYYVYTIEFRTIWSTLAAFWGAALHSFVSNVWMFEIETDWRTTASTIPSRKLHFASAYNIVQNTKRLFFSSCQSYTCEFCLGQKHAKTISIWLWPYPTCIQY